MRKSPSVYKKSTRSPCFSMGLYITFHFAKKPCTHLNFTRCPPVILSIPPAATAAATPIPSCAVDGRRRRVATAKVVGQTALWCSSRRPSWRARRWGTPPARRASCAAPTSSASTRPPVRWRPRRRCSPCGSTSRAPLRRARPCAGGRGGAAARVALLRAAHVHAPPAALRAGDGRPRRQGQLRARRRQR